MKFVPHRRLRQLVAIVALPLVFVGPAASTALAKSAPPPTKRHHVVSYAPIESAAAKNLSHPLQLPVNAPVLKRATAGSGVDPIDLKVLVLSATGDPNLEPELPVIQQVLDYQGTPYTVYVASKTPGGLTMDKLCAPCPPVATQHAFYNAVILTNGTLVYNNNGTWASALSQAEWQNLWTFEAGFGIRQVSWYTYPTPDFGFQWPTAAVSTIPPAAPITASYTAAAQSIWGTYANTATPATISYAYTYLALPLDSSTTPLLTYTDSAGQYGAAGTNYSLAAIRNYPDGRQNLAMTFDANVALVYASVLGYGAINWATKGLFLGQRHAFLQAQVDDVFIGDDVWSLNLPCGQATDTSGDGARMTGADLQAVANWQASKQAQSTSSSLMLNLAFNGVGTVPGTYTPDKLTPAAVNLADRFNWISHTYDHADLDTLAYDAVDLELTQNSDVGWNTLQLGNGPNHFNNFTDSILVTPSISGLTNPAALSAMQADGIRYVVTDTSQAGQNNPSPNIGIYNPIQPSLLEIPRHPVNLYFNVSQPAQWLAEDNCRYPAGAIGHVSSYQALLDRESSQLLLYMLRGDTDPLMFHQSNLITYDGTHFLLGDLLDATMTKYNHYFNLPIVAGNSMDQLGALMAARMAFSSSGVTANILPNTSVTLTSPKSVTVPVTGLKKVAVPTTTLTAAVGVADATLPVASTAGFPQSGSFTLVVHTEQMTVSVASPTSLTVAQRGANNTVAAAHAAGAAAKQGGVSISSEVYGGQNITKVQLTGGQSVTLPLT